MRASAGRSARPREASLAASAAAAEQLISCVSALSARIAALGGWRRVAVAFAAGSFSVLAMAPFFLSPVLFVTLPVLVWLIDGTRGEAAAAPRSVWQRPQMRAAAAGWWFGFGYFLFGLFWIGEAFLVEADKFAWLLPVAVTMLPAGLALFFGPATLAARLAWPHGIARVIVLAIALSCAEWLRGHVLTGFPWNVVGYALTWPLALMQSAAFFGIYGLTATAVLIFATPLVLVADGGRRARNLWTAAAIAVVPIVALYVLGGLRLASEPERFLDGARLRIVQASIDQRDKWRADKQGEIFRDQLELLRRDASGNRDDLAGVTHLIWPEAAMPFLPLEHPEALAAVGELLPDGAQLITGALRLKEGGKAGPGGAREGFNSLMVFNDVGQLSALYDKIHLVPFGEYLPFQAALESLGLEQLTRWRGGFSIGPEPRPLLAIAGLPAAAGLICYEAIFPAAVVQRAERPGILINVTNDGWFGDTTGPPQHFHQSRVRAVEEGLPMLRSANNGISAVVDANGRVLSTLGLNVRGVIDSPVPAAIAPTVYGRLGDRTFGAILIVLFLSLFVVARKQMK